MMQGGALALESRWYASPGGSPADVTGLTITITPVGGGAPVVGPTSVGITHEATGLYYYTWTVDPAAELTDYVALWEPDVGVPTYDTVTVTESANGLVVSLTRFKNWLKFGSGTSRDEDLSMVLETASGWVAWRISGPLTPTVITERIWSNGYLKQRKHPLIDVVSITPQDGSALPASSYIVDTTNSLVQMRYGGIGWHTMVYTAGLTTIAARHELAGMIVGQHLWRVENGTAGRGYPGSEDLVETPMGFAVPSRADEMLSADPDGLLMPGFA